MGARRLWRHNTVLPFAFAALVFIVVVDLTRMPAVNGGLYLSVLTAAALSLALLAPSLLRAGSVLESQRFEILPFKPFVILLARPVFGNPFRLLLTTVVVLGCGIAIVHLSLSPAQTALEILKLLGWALSGLVAVEIVEEVLRRTSSILLHTAVLLLLLISFLVLGSLRLVTVLLGKGSFPVMHGAWSSVLIGSSAGLKWQVAAAPAPFLLFIALVAIAKAVAERYRSLPPRTRQPSAWVRPVRTIARIFAPRAPASLAKELGLVTRVRVYWLIYVYFFALSAAAFSAKNPSLLPIAFLFWMLAGYNALGPDLPMGGLLRYDIMPRALKRTLAMRHAAILAVSVLTAVAAFCFVAAVRGFGVTEPRSIETSPSAYLIWFAYGATLFLLSTIMGDWMSVREPRAIGLRSVSQGGMRAGTASSGIVGFVAFVGTLATSGAFVLGAALVMGALGTHTDESGNFLPAILIASIVQLGLYAYRYIRSR